jgi:hypothetical protein
VPGSGSPKRTLHQPAADESRAAGNKQCLSAQLFLQAFSAGQNVIQILHQQSVQCAHRASAMAQGGALVAARALPPFTLASVSRARINADPKHVINDKVQVRQRPNYAMLNLANAGCRTSLHPKGGLRFLLFQKLHSMLARDRSARPGLREPEPAGIRARHRGRHAQLILR